MGLNGEVELRDPIRALGTFADYALARIRREVRPASISLAHDELDELADRAAGQVKRLRDEAETLLRRHGPDVAEHGMAHKRFADVYAQIAVLSRVTSIFEEHGVEASGQERFIAETFCTGAANRADQCLDRLFVRRVTGAAPRRTPAG